MQKTISLCFCTPNNVSKHCFIEKSLIITDSGDGRNFSMPDILL